MISKLPVVISTAHNSGYVPHDILVEMLGAQASDLNARETRLAQMFHEGDPYTDIIFHVPGAVHLHALVSRFVVDLNRERSEFGPNGVVKLTDFQRRPLYPDSFTLTPETTEDRLRRYWDPYHTSYDELLARDDISFFIDGHSMTEVGPPLGPDAGRPRPALTLMTGGDRYGEPLAPGVPPSVPADTAYALLALLEQHFADAMTLNPNVPAEVRLNDPFAVAGVQLRHCGPDAPTPKPGFSIEVNRALYLAPRADGLSDVIPGSIEALNAAFNTFVPEATKLFPVPSLSRAS
ncbi:MAG: N-formylglutamate amidohydrolase [Trueperaceae bacterium]|nr:N-formylglutamate amidohydrolase [Trueperaceae bacterium]